MRFALLARVRLERAASCYILALATGSRLALNHGERNVLLLSTSVIKLKIIIKKIPTDKLLGVSCLREFAGLITCHVQIKSDRPADG